MARQILALLVIGGLCGTLLVTADAITSQQIQSNRQAQARLLYEDLLQTPLPDSLGLDAPPFGNCGQWLMGPIAVPGYAAGIELVGLWWPKPEQISLRTVRHLETPGIGDFIDSAVSSWMHEQDGQSPDHWQALDNVSGATITTQAIRRAAAEFSRQMQLQCRDTAS